MLRIRRIILRAGLCLAVSLAAAQAQPAHRVDSIEALDQFSQNVQALAARVAPSVVQVSVLRYAPSEDEQGSEAGGFIEVDRTKVVVITDEFIERPAIDPVIVRKELADVQAELAKMLGEAIDRTQAKEVAASATLIAKENWLAAQLELYGDPPPATLRPYEEYGPPATNDDEAAAESGTAPGAP